jgi:chromate transport protein ChrA
MQAAHVNRVQRLLWPPTDDDEGARRAALQGCYAAGFSAAVTTLAALAAAFGKGFWGSNLANLIDAAIFAAIAWGIYRMSRSAAVLGLAWYLVGRLDFWVRFPNAPWAILLVVALFALMYVNSIRGTFSYRRRPRASDQTCVAAKSGAVTVRGSLAVKPARPTSPASRILRADTLRRGGTALR